MFLLLAACDLQGQSPAIREETFQGRHAWVLSNELIRVSILSGGGHIAEVRLLSPDPKKSVNPMRVPHYPTIDPHIFNPAKHDAIYGNDSSRWLMSGYMGHLLCFPSYGPPSPDEARAGLGGHGEAAIVEWKQMRVEERADRVTLWYGANLTRTQFRVERAVTLPRGQRFVRVREWVENLEPYDRPINWMQHATFGPPFVEPGKTVMDVSATRGKVSEGRAGSDSLQPGSEVTWPEGTTSGGTPADLRVFQTKPHSGTYYVLRLDPARQEQFFTMFHRDYRVLIGYVFPAEGNPWLADWQENRNNKGHPWDSQVIARGIEFGSSPVDEGLKKSVERGSLFWHAQLPLDWWTSAAWYRIYHHSGGDSGWLRGSTESSQQRRCPGIDSLLNVVRGENFRLAKSCLSRRAAATRLGTLFLCTNSNREGANSLDYRSLGRGKPRYCTAFADLPRFDCAGQCGGLVKCVWSLAVASPYAASIGSPSEKHEGNSKNWRSTHLVGGRTRSTGCHPACPKAPTCRLGLHPSGAA